MGSSLPRETAIKDVYQNLMELAEKKPVPTNDLESGSMTLEDRFSRKGGIVGIVPRGEVLRNFDHTGAFERIADATDLTLVSVSVSPEIDSSLTSRFGEVYWLKEFAEPWVVRIQREIIGEAHNRWVWSRAARERSRLRDAEASSLIDKWKRFGKKLISYPTANRNGLRMLTKLERASSRRLSPKAEYERLFLQLNPSLVFNGSHVHSSNATQAVQTAQWLGIPTATFIFSWDNLTSQGRIMLPYDHFLVWNEALRDQLLAMYEWIKPENVFVTGTPQFDFHFQSKYYLERHEFCRRYGLDPDREFVLYSTGMANHMPGEPEIVEQIADVLSSGELKSRPQLLVRVYPKDRTGRFDELKARRKDIVFPEIEWDENWLTPKAEDSVALVNTLRHCVLGINVASTVSLELCMFDKPVINVGYNPRSVPVSVLSFADYYEFDHYKPIIESGAVQVARSPEEMSELIHSALNRPEARSGDRKRLIERMFGSTLDGRSAERVAGVLIELAQREKKQK